MFRDKDTLRKTAKTRRKARHLLGINNELVHNFPASNFKGAIIAGYWPIGTEIDVRPLLHALHAQGESLCLPITPDVGNPLFFRAWTPKDRLVQGRFGTKEPSSDKTPIEPDVILVPLLAFSPNGDRLGYGGGYYDRTLAGLRSKKQIFACGVAYAGQEMVHIPTDTYDQRLDGILTEKEFRTF